MARPKREHKETRVKINLSFDEALAALTRAPWPRNAPPGNTSAESNEVGDTVSTDDPRQDDT